MNIPLNSSPSKTYVIPVYSNDFKSISYKKFILPDYMENNCSVATWYFYNKLDAFSCGESAYPFEMHNDIIEI